MVRTIGGAVAGAIAWMVLATAIGLLLGMAWPALAAASRAPTSLTLAMLAARLGVSFVASILSGAIATRIGRNDMAALASGVLLLLVWGPYHMFVIWHLFPVWYHLTFLLSLPLLAWLGARFAPLRGS
jgi:hypothetical protein